jgi:hypothetical protein
MDFIMNQWNVNSVKLTKIFNGVAKSAINSCATNAEIFI